MRRLLFLLLVLLLCSPLRAQYGNTVTITGVGAPTGGCVFVMRYMNSAAGTYYYCTPAGAWVLVGAGAGATTALDNLAAVAINTSLLPGAVNTVGFGSATLPITDLFLGVAANKSAHFTYTLNGNRAITVPDANSTMVVADTGAANNFLTAISAAGAISKAQPAFTNISGTATSTQGGFGANLSAAGAGNYPKSDGGTPAVFAASTLAAAGIGTCTNQVVTALTGDTAPTCTTLTNAYTTGTFAATAHNVLSATHGDSTTAAAVRGDGIFAIGGTPTWQKLAHSGAAGGYFKWNGTDVVASTGAAGGTGTCTNQAVTAENADAAPTCTTITSTYTSGNFPAVPDAWNAITAAGGALSIANTSYASTFTQTSGVNWSWNNITGATSGVAQSSPIFNLGGRTWHGGVDTADNWSLQNIVTNGTDGASTLTFAHTGSSGTASLTAPSLTLSTTPLAVTSGGTGLTGGTSGGIPYYSGVSAITSSAALTVNVLVKGGGIGAAPAVSLCTDNATTLTCTDPGGVVASSFTGTGANAGFVDFVQGAAQAATANSVGFQAPTSVTSAFHFTLPGAPAVGLLHATNATPSVLSVGPVVGGNMTNNTVTSTQLAVVNTRRTCIIPIGNGTDLIVDADFSPFKQARCFIPAASTIVEISVVSDGGTPDIMLQRRTGASTLADLLSAVLATGGTTLKCAMATTSQTCIDGTTSDNAITVTTALAAGVWIEVKSGTAGGTAKAFDATVVYTVNP